MGGGGRKGGKVKGQRRGGEREGIWRYQPEVKRTQGEGKRA